MRRLAFACVSAILLTGCGGSAPTWPDIPTRFTESGDAIPVSKNASGGVFKVYQGVTWVFSFRTMPATRFSGAAASFDQLTALYRAGYRLHAVVEATNDEGASHCLGLVCDALSVSLSVAGPTAVPLTTSSDSVSASCTSSCPEPGGPDWTGGQGAILQGKSATRIYPWTVFRADGDYHTMAEVEKRGWEETMQRALAEARENGKKLYVSFDVDVLDPAFVPGTGTPVPGGLTMREALPIVRRLCAENELIGFDIVELAPVLDDTFRSALNANHIMHACLTGVAMRKKGITDPGFLSELATDHGQPEAGLQAERDGKAEKVDPDYGAGSRPRD